MRMLNTTLPHFFECQFFVLLGAFIYGDRLATALAGAHARFQALFNGFDERVDSGASLTTSFTALEYDYCILAFTSALAQT